MIPTLFSPLSIARKLSGERLDTDLRERPAEVISALEAITETVIRFADLALTEGVSGIFYSTERDREFDFSYPILEAGLQVMVRDEGRAAVPTPTTPGVSSR